MFVDNFPTHDAKVDPYKKVGPTVDELKKSRPSVSTKGFNSQSGYKFGFDTEVDETPKAVFSRHPYERHDKRYANENDKASKLHLTQMNTIGIPHVVSEHRLDRDDSPYSTTNNQYFGQAS
jgi:hypothetical protein